MRRQGGEIGRRARLRIAKSSISKQRFSFQRKSHFTRGKRDSAEKLSLSRCTRKPDLKLAQILAQTPQILCRLGPDFAGFCQLVLEFPLFSMVAYREFVVGRKVLGLVSAAHGQPIDFFGYE
jgi:hypothetical protein